MKVWRPLPGELEKLRIKNWGTWEKEISRFDWSYEDTETCYILEGKARVTSKDGKETIEFKTGDLVQFPKGLSCVWNVIEPLRKRYKFGEK